MKRLNDREQAELDGYAERCNDTAAAAYAVADLSDNERVPRQRDAAVAEQDYKAAIQRLVYR